LRNFTLRLVICLLGLIAVAARADEAPATIEHYHHRLDRTRATLDEVAKALSDPAVSDGALRLLRDRIDPLPRDLEETIDRLTPRLAAIDARLKELGAPPAPPPEQKSAAGKPAEAKADAAKKPEAKPADAKTRPAAGGPPAAPAATTSAAAASVNAEWAEQRKLFDDVDATLKRARALLLEARQTIVAIVARQRAIFANTLFLRTNGLFSPALWRAAAAEAPAVARAAADFLRDRAANFMSRLDNGRAPAFIALVLLILLCVPPAILLARRVLARVDAETPPTRLEKAAGAAWAALVSAAVPIAAVAALGAALDGFNLVDGSLEPVLRRIFEGVARTALAYAIARAAFAPAHPRWRLLDPGDSLARRLTRLAVAVAATVSLAQILEQIEETVQAGLPVVVATRGLGVVAAAIFLSSVLIGFRRRDDVSRASSPHERDWLSLSRFIGFGVIAVILGACAAGYVTFANFFILQAGWFAALGALLYIVLGLATAGTEAAFEPASPLGRGLISGLGLRHEQLGQIAVLLSGVATLLCYGAAVLVALAPFGVESGDFLAGLKAAFFSFKVGDVTISPSSALAALLLFSITLAAMQGLRRWLDTRYLPLTRLDTGLRNSIGTSVSYAGFLMAAAIALSHLGLGFEKLAIVAGALSVGIGFGLQSIVNNFVSGLILLWERAIRVGDWVVLGDEQGYVKRINVRSTEIETFDRATMIVPNSNLVAGVVKNWLRGDKVGRIKIAMSPHCGVDPERMRDVLIAAARAQEGVLRIPAPQVMFLGMESNTFRFELWCYVEDVELSTRVRSDLHFDLHKRLADAGITIAAASSPPPPTIVQFPGLEKLAAAAALGAFAVGEAVERGEEAPAEAEKTTA
jgi:small-conductance mechanosensitive channel